MAKVVNTISRSGGEVNWLIENYAVFKHRIHKDY